MQKDKAKAVAKDAELLADCDTLEQIAKRATDKKMNSAALADAIDRIVDN